MNLNHIQTVAKYESKILRSWLFWIMAVLSLAGISAVLLTYFSLMDLWNGRHWPRMSRGLEIISMPSYRRSS